MTIDEKKLTRFMLEISCLTVLALGAGCAHKEAPQPSSAVVAQSASEPDLAKARAHFEKHVTYPASRGQILQACAQTREFTQSEKQWLSDKLPDGTYASADEVLRALGI